MIDNLPHCRLCVSAWLALPRLELHAATDRLPAGHAQHAHAFDEGERLQGKHVLIVEDQALLALELELAFRDEGAEVIGPALTLEAARELVLAPARIDAAVLDVDLAGHDVYPVAAMLQKRDVPFLFHTGHGTATELHRLFPNAVTCVKPTLPGALVAALLDLI